MQAMVTCTTVTHCLLAQQALSLQMMLRYGILHVAYFPLAFVSSVRLNPRKQTWERLRERMQPVEALIAQWLDSRCWLFDCPLAAHYEALVHWVVTSNLSFLTCHVLPFSVGPNGLLSVETGELNPEGRVISIGAPLSPVPWQKARGRIAFIHLLGQPRLWYIATSDWWPGASSAEPLFYVPTQQEQVRKIVQVFGEILTIPAGSWFGGVNMGYNVVEIHQEF